jgi:hypothetical protein
MMFDRRCFWLVLALLMWQTGPASAQDDAPADEAPAKKAHADDKTHDKAHESSGDSHVPPWGRDLDEHGAAAHHEEHGEAEKHRWHFLGEYLLMFTKNDRIPPLLTTGPTADARPGAIGREFTRILYTDAIDFEERHGGRFTLERTLGEEWSVSASYFLLGSRDVGPKRTSPGSPVLARPFFDVVNNREDSFLVAFPGLASGSFRVNADSFLQGAELNLQRHYEPHEHRRIVLFAGLRYLDLDEELDIAEVSSLTSGPLAGRRVGVLDRFETDNDFFGGQVGAGFECDFKRFTFNLTAKVALGNVHETVAVRGRTVIDTTPATDVPAGLFALSSNSGSFSRDTFAVVPEVSAKLAFHVSERLLVFGGYSYLYWSNVARPGEQIDRNLNPNLIPTSATFGGPATPRQPAAGFRTSDYWMQGMIFGLELRY